mmetsp:Transcript_3725/g.4479  ORF Transcript_3725/g.4479 Transcript_3725/m.4479 type:complete len:270 (-) Transcript_3725:1132-1941(-)
MEMKNDYKKLKVKHAEVLASNEALTKDIRKFQGYARNQNSSLKAVAEKVRSQAMKFGILETPDPTEFIQMISDRLSVLHKEREALEAENQLTQDEKIKLEDELLTMQQKYKTLSTHRDEIQEQYQYLEKRLYSSEGHSKELEQDRIQLDRIAAEEANRLSEQLEQLKQEKEMAIDAIAKMKEKHKQSVRFLEKENLELMMEMRKIREEQRLQAKRVSKPLLSTPIQDSIEKPQSDRKPLSSIANKVVPQLEETKKVEAVNENPPECQQS